MEPTPVPRTPRPQIATGSPPAADGAAAPPAETAITTPRDSVETWTTEKITPFAPAADQRIVVKEMGKPHGEELRSMSIGVDTRRALAGWSQGAPPFCP